MVTLARALCTPEEAVKWLACRGLLQNTCSCPSYISHAVREMMAGSGVVGVVVKESPVGMFHYRCRLFFLLVFLLLYINGASQ